MESSYIIDVDSSDERKEWKYTWIWTILIKVFNGIVAPLFHWIIREFIQMIFSTKLMRPSGTIRTKCVLWILGLLWRVFTTLSCYGNAVIINSWIEQYYPNGSETLYNYLLVIALIMFQYMIEWFVSVLSDDRFEQIDNRFEQIDNRFEQIDNRFEQIETRFEKRFEVLFRHLGIPDPVNPASPELMLEMEENINDWKMKQRKDKFFKDA